MRLYPLARAAMKFPIVRMLRPLIPIRLDHRLELLKRMPEGAHCAEIGVWKGEFSERIIEITKPKMLHLVDPWIYQPKYPSRLYGGKSAKDQQDMDTIFENVKNKFHGFENVKIHRTTSKAFFEELSGELDWVYIDGDHSAEAVLQDLKLSHKNLAQSGFISGDDYNWKDYDGLLPVKSAVDKFCVKYDYNKEILGGQFILRSNAISTRHRPA